MKFIVEAVSKFGIMGPNKVWYNADKNSAPDFSAVRKGNEVELELNGKYFSKVTVLGNGSPTNSGAAASGAKAAGNGYQRSPSDSAQMARSVAVKAVLESDLLREAALKLGMEAAETDAFLELRTKRYSNYIITGDFEGKTEEK
jgi:hypothetical protein